MGTLNAQKKMAQTGRQSVAKVPRLVDSLTPIFMGFETTRGIKARIRYYCITNKLKIGRWISNVIEDHLNSLEVK
jgi:hypothetical protein